MDTWTLSLLRLTSPALPVGAFAYSRGLEPAVHAGWVHDEASAQAWIAGLLRAVTMQLDAPLLVRLYRAHEAHDRASCEAACEYWNALLLASRESRELYLEDTQMGAALARMLSSLDVTVANVWDRRDDACFVTLFALAAVHFGIPLQSALLGYMWTVVESQTSAAVRLIPLGQTAGQRILGELSQLIPSCAEHALVLPDDELGGVAHGLAIASALHETQYSRLFRS